MLEIIVKYMPSPLRRNRVIRLGYGVLVYLSKALTYIKDYVLEILYAHIYHPYLFAEVKELPDETVMVKFNNGLQFYGRPNKGGGSIPNFIKYAAPKEVSFNWHKFTNFFSIMKEIYWNKQYLRYYKLRRGDIVIDCGAHVGFFTIQAAKIVGNEGKVIAIEPEKENLRMLRKNIELNGVQNVIVVEKGLWSKRTIKTLSFGWSSSSPSFVLKHLDYPERTEVEMDTLDNIIFEDTSLPKVDFVKMDIEGSEIEALKGLTKALGFYPISLAIAAYHTIGGQQTQHAVRALLKQSTKERANVHYKNGFVYVIPQK